MGIKSIGVQQYMFRDHFKDEDEAACTLKKIREIGFDSIEICDILINPEKSLKGTPLEVKIEYDWVSLLTQADMKVCGIHDTLENLRKHPEYMINKAVKLGTNCLVAAVTVETDFSCAESVKRLVKNLNDLGKLLKDSGITLLYHNHNRSLIEPPKIILLGWSG